MALAFNFIDGFDYLTAANLGLKWDGAAFSISAGTGVYGKGKSLVLNTGGSLPKTLATNVVTGGVGFHAFVASLGAFTLFQFKDAGTIQVDLRMDATGAFFFTRNGTAIGSTSTFRAVTNSWYWFELNVTIDPTVGAAALSINGNSVLTGTGLNTRNSANSFYNQLAIVGNSNSGFSQVDSFHSFDSSGGGFPYGEHIIDTQLANAVGSNTTWTKGGSTINTNNYQQVNEANEDGDVTYVTSNTAGQIDSYGFASLLESAGSIGVIAVDTIDRIDDAPMVHTFDHFVKSSASSALSSAFTPTSTYLNHQSFFTQDPNTSAAWSVSGRNAAEFGYKDIS
jgi:hypothetical protein